MRYPSSRDRRAEARIRTLEAKPAATSGSSSSSTTTVVTSFAVGAWTSITAWQNTWADYGAPFPPPGWLMDPFGFVHLRGTIKRVAGGPADLEAMFLLQSDVWPRFEQIHLCRTDAGAGYLNIATNGEVRWRTGDGIANLTLNGITFDTRT